VIGSLEIGGAEGHLAQVLPELKRLGWAPHVVTLLGLGPIARQLGCAGIAVREIATAQRTRRWPRWLRRSLGLPLLIADLYRELRARPHELTWVLLPQAYLLTMIAAGLRHHTAPMVMSRRSLNRYQGRYPGVRMLERRLHRRPAAVLANSTAVMNELEREEGVSPDRLVLIHNGIDCRRFEHAVPRTTTRRLLSIPNKALVLCTIANLIPYKGHHDLLCALASVREQLPPWRLLCVGAGESRPLVKATARLGLEREVLWLGRRSDVVDLLAASDIGVLASHEEGFSNAVLESMAAGLPVVATRVGGNYDAVLDGETGILISPRAPAAMGQAILRLAVDRELARRMGEAGRARVAQYFSLQQCVAAYDRVFSAVIEGRPLPADPAPGGSDGC
jgi:glycosyltransferase involved in cell wall biosynthesis